jgi:hypothetical protein
MGKATDDQYSEEETQRRVEATLRAAFNTPRPAKNVQRKQAESKAKPRTAEKASTTRKEGAGRPKRRTATEQIRKKAAKPPSR